MNHPVQSGQNRSPSHSRSCLPVTFRKSLSLSPTASSPSEDGGERDSYASSGEMDDEACSGPSSSPVQPPVVASSSKEHHMRDMREEGLPASLPREGDIKAPSSPLSPTLALPHGTPPCESTFIRSARSQEGTSDSILMQAGRQMVDILATGHGFMPEVVLAVFKMCGDIAATDVILKEMADAAQAVLHLRYGDRESGEPAPMA
ncbi:hypothetical protein B0H19DRAFT_1276143 [Mycena capillaripes]|nr:hypothetical protein B0H19DRAFT_1276143 [Mycena capillaripes]